MSELVPKQVNWDLKRGVEKRLKILEKRTHRALMELMQEEEKRRLEEAGGIADADEDEIIEKLDNSGNDGEKEDQFEKPINTT